MIDTPLYDFEVAWSEPDRLYVATLTDLRGNVARSTIRAATLAALTSAIGLWIEQAEILAVTGKQLVDLRNDAVALAGIRQEQFLEFAGEYFSSLRRAPTY